jgi:hypothetical protein
LKQSVFVTHHLWISACTSRKRFLCGPHDVDSDSFLPSCFSNVGIHMTFYLEPFIPIPFDTISTLKSCRDTPSFDTPLVTGYGEGVRQKILIRQVFDRCVVVRGRQEEISCIPHLPYPWEVLEGVLTNRFFTLIKNSSKRLGKHLL